MTTLQPFAPFDILADTQQHSSVVVGERFNGPPGTANGGYICGTIAQRLPGTVHEVTLRAPTPLDTTLHLQVAGSAARLTDHAGVVVAQARTVEASPVPPPAVPVAMVEASEAAFAGYDDHPFPTCFVCGADRTHGDGLRILTAPLLGAPDIVVATWTPDAEHAGPDGTVATPIVWCALDCPTGLAHHGGGEHAVLGRLTGSVVGPVLAGRPHVVVARRTGRDGRKLFAHAGIYDPDGTLVATSAATWITFAASPDPQP